MHRRRENLDIIFRMTTPEMVMKSLHNQNKLLVRGKKNASAKEYSWEAYEHYAPGNFEEYSKDEIELQYKDLYNIKSCLGKNGGIFAALYDFANEVLWVNGPEPRCRLEHILNWNSITKRLGQDIFVTCLLAGRDYLRGRKSAWCFTWPASLRCDDNQLQKIMEKGLAENHFHLFGSSQNFSLSWACLMNHPRLISRYLSEMAIEKDNLNIRIMRGVEDNVLSWTERLKYAVAIRVWLTGHCLGLWDHNYVEKEFKKFECCPQLFVLQGQVEMLRINYGVRFEQPNRSYKCLDYANSNMLYCVDKTNYNRLLAGERSFLYSCFYLLFQGEFSDMEANMLYLYLVIKSNFRSELIQNNGLPGFKNFQDYQDRKAVCFERVPEYMAESCRMGVMEPLRQGNVKSLEARIMPKKTASQMAAQIQKIDEMVCFDERCGEDDYYYVTQTSHIKNAYKCL